MNRPSALYETHRDTRAGFTLVEMLVSVTLVLLMMTMFAQIFSTLCQKTVSSIFPSNKKNLPQKVDSQMFLSLENQMMTRFLAFTKLWCFNQIFINQSFIDQLFDEN